jgi:hypothetical protein
MCDEMDWEMELGEGWMMLVSGSDEMYVLPQVV